MEEMKNDGINEIRPVMFCCDKNNIHIFSSSFPDLLPFPPILEVGPRVTACR